MNIVAFEEAVCGKGTATPAMRAGVWEENGEAVSEQESSVAGHANAVVGEAMEEEHGVAIALAGLDDPGAEDNAILRCDGNVFHLGANRVGDLAHCGFFFLSQGTACGVKGSVGHVDTCDDADPEIQEQEQTRKGDQTARSSYEGHESSKVDTGRQRVAFPVKLRR